MSAHVAAPRWIYYALLGAVILIPLPIGGIYQWSWAGLAMLLGLQLAAWAIALLGEVRRPIFWPPLRRQGGLLLPGLLYLAVLLWTAVQAAPLGLGPSEIWDTASEMLALPVVGSISLAPEKTLAGVVELLTLGAVFWLALQFGRDAVLVRRGLWLIVIVGLVYGLYGVAMVLSGIEKVLWFDKASYIGSVTGPYVNRNMYAFYAGLGLLCTSSLLLGRVATAQRRTDSFWRALRIALVKDANETICLVVAVLIYLLIVALAESRGGALSSAFAVAVMAVAMLLRQPRPGRQRWGLAIGSLVLVGLVAYTITGAHLDGRFESHYFDDGGRLAAYGVVLAAVADAPWTGYGYGAFAEMFFNRNDGAVWLAYNYAHNLYLGAAAQLGLPAAVALMTSVLLIAIACAGGVRRRRRFPAFPALGLGVTVLAATHGLVDSPLFVPANAVTFSFILGLAYAQAFSEGRTKT
jgi:O-antigen ligase